MSVAVIAVIGGLSLLPVTSGETKAAATDSRVIATSCGGFAADAAKLFDNTGPTILQGAFAPGDHVHLAIDLRGNGYSWEMTGALATRPDVTTTSWWTRLFKTTKWSVSTSSTYAPDKTLLSTSNRGNINGYATWKLEFDVTTAGDGALTITRTDAASTRPKIAIASCTRRKSAPV